MAQDLLVMNPPRGKRRRNPRGIAWSGCVARPKHRGRRVRMVRYAAGRRPSAFTWARFIGRTASKRLLKACRRAKYGRGCGPMKRSITKSRKCRRSGGRGGRTRCFTARGRRVCFKVRK